MTSKYVDAVWNERASGSELVLLLFVYKIWVLTCSESIVNRGNVGDILFIFQK